MSEHRNSEPNLGFRRHRPDRGREQIIGHGQQVKREVEQFAVHGGPSPGGRKTFTARYGGVLPNT